MITYRLTNSASGYDSDSLEFELLPTGTGGSDNLLTDRLISVENSDKEGQHERLIYAWIHRANSEWIHKQCSWHLAEGHPVQGIYSGRTFYDEYVNQLSSIYCHWEQRIGEVIGTSIGAIVVGEYRFQWEESQHRYWAPFVHFYRIHQRELTGVRYYMGAINHCSV